MTTKLELRRQLLKKRRSLPAELWREKSDNLCHKLQSLPLFAQATTILAYFSFRQEPDLNSLFEIKKVWGFPRCVDKSLLWHRWQPGEELKKGAYGIFEPDANSVAITAKEVDLILVPAVACDQKGYRLGYGGGFYDRLLSNRDWQDIPTIGIVFDFALVPQLPVDSWDQRLHGVCTDAGWEIN